MSAGSLSTVTPAGSDNIFLSDSTISEPMACLDDKKS
jgi:hypothetical protein